MEMMMINREKPAQGIAKRGVGYIAKISCIFMMSILATFTPISASADDKAIIVTDLFDREITVNGHLKKVVFSEGRQLYLLAALNKNNPVDYIAGWRHDLVGSDPDNYKLLAARFPAIENIPDIGRFGTDSFNLEEVVTLMPDAVIVNTSQGALEKHAEVIKKLDGFGIPVIYIDFRHDVLNNTEPTFRLFGKLFGFEQKAEELIEFRAAQIKRVTDVIAAKAPARPKVFVERIGGYSDDCCLTFGDENFGKFVELVGGSNITKDLIKGTFGQLNPEQVIEADPEHIIITSANWEAYVPGGRWIPVGPNADLAEVNRKLEFYPTRPAYTGIKANGEVKNFHAIWHGFYTSPFHFVAIQQLAKWIHPELFEDIDPDQTFAEFHDKFMPIDHIPGYFGSLSQDDE